MNADGTCEFRSLSDYFHPKPFRNNDGEEASYLDYPARMCCWKLGTDTAYVWHRRRTVAAVQFQADFSAGKEYAGTRGWHPSLYEEGGRLVLWTYIGDADNGRPAPHDVSLWFNTDRIDDLYRVLTSRRLEVAHAQLADGPLPPKELNSSRTSRTWSTARASSASAI